MKVQRITSLTALMSFILLLLTSIILYMTPHGRVAYWSNWKLLGLSKTEWGNIHITTGVLFLLAIFLHIYYNWKPILLYLKNKSRQLKVFTKEFNIALILTLLVALGTYFETPPVFWVIDAADAIKNSASLKYGEPPYGHAELSTLTAFGLKMQLDPKDSMARLKANGFSVDNAGQTISDIAALNQTTPQQIYLAMRPPEKKNAGVPTLPDSPPPGFGNQSLETICTHYQLNTKSILDALTEKNIIADPGMSIRNIAEQNNISPFDVYLVIQEKGRGPEL